MRIIQAIGNKELWKRDKTLFLTSKRAPLELYSCIFSWVDSLTEKDCVVCFNTSELEVEVMKALIENGIQIVLVVMNRFREQNNLQIERALEKGGMLVLVQERDEPKNAGATPRLRNEFVASKVQRIVCGFVSPHGSIRPLVTGRPNVTCLEPAANVREPEGSIHRPERGRGQDFAAHVLRRPQHICHQ